ncbi:MAG: hypothetical protein PF447_02575 [Spirochaetaceae bacterium]|jgi:hypothetical protein|nr:hypothetical protein [Spirochaetaceae bacterium]
MKHIYRFFLAVLIIAALSCSLGFLEEDNGGGDSGGEDTASAYGEWDWSTRTYSYYNANDTLDIADDTLEYYREYDFNDQRNAVFYKEYLGSYVEYVYYQWNDDATLHAIITFDDSKTQIEAEVFSYDSSGRLIQQDILTEATGEYFSGMLYSYEGDMEEANGLAVIAEDQTAVMGTLFTFQDDKPIVRRTYKDISATGICDFYSRPTLDVNQALVTPSAPAPASATADQLAQSSGLANYNLDTTADPVEPLIDDFDVQADAAVFSTSLHDLLDGAIARIWDSYWYYDIFTDSDSYNAVTFTADGVPLPDTTEAQDFVYGLLEQYSPDSQEIQAIINDTIDDDIHLPVTYYLEASDLTTEIDGPLQIDLTYVPGTYVPSSKVTKYKGQEILSIDMSYLDENGLFESVSFSGDVLAANLSLSVDYFDNYIPEAINLFLGSTDGVLLQKFVYTYNLDGGGIADTETDINTISEEDMLTAIHSILWYDGDYEESAVDNSAALVGSLDFEYDPDPDGDAGTDDATLTAIIKDASGTTTSSYELYYTVSGIRTGFASFDADGNELFRYEYGYDDAMELADYALGQVSEIKYENQIPDIPYLGDFNQDDPIEMLLNEVEVFLP